MKTTFLRSTMLAAAVLGVSASAANAGNVSFGLGFYSPAPVYYEPYYYPQPVYYAPSYRFVAYQPAYVGWNNGWHRGWEHRHHEWRDDRRWGRDDDDRGDWHDHDGDRHEWRGRR